MLKNTLLQEAMAKVEAGAKDRQSFDRIVQAGTKIIYNKEMFAKLIDGIDDAPDPVQAVAEGMIGVLGLMRKQSRNTMPVEPMIQAGMALLIDALDFLEQAGRAKIDKETLGKATSIYINTLLPKLGITPDKMDEMMARVKGTMGDPAKMSQYQQTKGVAA